MHLDGTTRIPMGFDYSTSYLHLNNIRSTLSFTKDRNPRSEADGHNFEECFLRLKRLKRALFICSQNRLRSPTAEEIFASWPGVETDSAGLGGDATVPLSSEQIAWANIIFVMEKAH